MHIYSDESEVLETQTTETEQETNTEATEEATETPEEDIEALRAKADELERKNRQLYERLKKQEKVEGGMSEYDMLAIKNSNITEKEDLDTVKEYAKKLNLSIAEALEDRYVKTVLADRAEERRTARATETRSPRGISKSTGEDILRKAESTGEVPDSMDAMRQLVEARFQRKLKK